MLQERALQELGELQQKIERVATGVNQLLGSSRDTDSVDALLRVYDAGFTNGYDAGKAKSEHERDVPAEGDKPTDG